MVNRKTGRGRQKTRDMRSSKRKRSKPRSESKLIEAEAKKRKTKINYQPTPLEIKKLPKEVKRFYDILTEERKELFWFLYSNPLESLGRSSGGLASRVTNSLNKSSKDEVQMQDLMLEAGRYTLMLDACQSYGNSELVQITLGFFKKEHPKVIQDFKERIPGLMDKATEQRERLNEALKQYRYLKKQKERRESGRDYRN